MINYFGAAKPPETVIYNTTSAYNIDTAASGMSAILVFAMIAISLSIVILEIVAKAKIFKKAGKPGWAAIVPFYNNWVFFEVAGLEGALSLVCLIFSPYILYAYYKLCKNFGKSTGFFILTIFFTQIMLMILGFGKSEYLGNASGSSASNFGGQPAQSAANPFVSDVDSQPAQSAANPFVSDVDSQPVQSTVGSVNSVDSANSPNPMNVNDHFESSFGNQPVQGVVDSSNTTSINPALQDPVDLSTQSEGLNSVSQSQTNFSTPLNSAPQSSVSPSMQPNNNLNSVPQNPTNLSEQPSNLPDSTDSTGANNSIV